jgi:hypothetical protein
MILPGSPVLLLVVVYNLEYLSLPDDEKLCETSSLLIFLLISNDGNF